MTGRSPSGRGRVAVWTAAAAGGLHALASLYWALGGRWLLATVGQWAVDLADRDPLAAGAALGGVAAVKATAAAVPVAVAHGRLPRPDRWRALTWAGGLFLVAYGGLNTAVALAVLSGAVHPDGGYDPAAMRGHAYLWDPLFLLWGAALVVWLRSSRPAAP